MEKERSGTGAGGGGGEPLVLSGVCSLQGCIAKHHSTKAHQVRFGGPVEAEVFTGRIKKSTERSRLAKSLLWFKQGTRPVVTSLFASEAGVGGAAGTLPALGTVCVRGRRDNGLPPPRRHPENYYSFVLKEHTDREKSTLGKSYRFQHRLKPPKKHKIKGSTSWKRSVCVELSVTPCLRGTAQQIPRESSGFLLPGPCSSCASPGRGSGQCPGLGSAPQSIAAAHKLHTTGSNPSAKGHR